MHLLLKKSSKAKNKTIIKKIKSKFKKQTKYHDHQTIQKQQTENKKDSHSIFTIWYPVVIFSMIITVLSLTTININTTIIYHF